MADDMARAVGASGSNTVEIAGKQCTARGLTLKELGEVERLCLRAYQRSYVEAYESTGANAKQIEEARERAARWDVDDLPSKAAYDPRKIKLNRELKCWVDDQFGDEKRGDYQYKILVATSLDNGTLTERNYRKLTGQKPIKQSIPYSTWWITGCFDGMVSFVWVCFKHNGVTMEQVTDAMRENQELLIGLTREIEHLTTPAVGNG